MTPHLLEKGAGYVMENQVEQGPSLALCQRASLAWFRHDQRLSLSSLLWLPMFLMEVRDAA